MTDVAIFFYAKNQLLLHGCPLEEAEPYGDFLNYPYSHDAIWEKHYHRIYRVDFDYYPRGRVIYNKANGQYIIYHDRCAEAQARELRKQYGEDRAVLRLDEHYQCHWCNSGYSLIDRM